MKNRKLTKEQLLAEKNKAYKSHTQYSGDEYQPQKINWKKVTIIISVLATFVTGAVLIWMYAFKGKDYLDYKDLSKKTYTHLLVDPDESWIANQNFINDKLKHETEVLTSTMKDIYNKNKDGFEYNSNARSKLHYKYRANRQQNPLIMSSTDYLWQFVDKTLKKNISVKNSGVPDYYLSWQFMIRIIDNKIAAIGFVEGYDPKSPPKKPPFHWLLGSKTDNMKGK